MPSPESIPFDIATDLSQLKPLTESKSWINNRHKFSVGGVAVRFLSWRTPGLDVNIVKNLGLHDKAAEDEAYETGQLDHYEPGTPVPENETRLIKNWCKWKTREAARAATHRPRHIGGAAYAIMNNAYRYALVEQYDVFDTNDPLNPHNLELTGTITLPQIEAHYDAMKKRK